MNLGLLTTYFDNTDSVNSSGHVGVNMNQHEPASAPKNLAGNYLTTDLDLECVMV